MSRLEGWWARLRPWLRRGTMEREIDEEFAFHLEREIAQLRASGLGDAEARRAAHLRFGGLVRYREEVRERWTGRIGRLASDVRQGFRRTRRRPGLALAAVLTLALGIGANTAIFSLVRSTLFRPLPYAHPEELVIFWDASGDVTDDTRTSLRELVEYRRALSAFSDLASYTGSTVNLTETEPERIVAALVTGNLFATLGAAPLLGRVIGPDDAEPGRPLVAVLGHGVWQRQFGGRRDILGATIRMSGQAATIVGVMPATFRLPLDYRDGTPTEVFLPNPIDTTRELAWGNRSYFIVGRLAGGVTLAQAEAAVHAAHVKWTQEIAELADDHLEGRRAPIPVHALLFRDVGRSLTLIFAAVGVLLLVACGNVAHLLLASGDARRRELATQAVLGATRWRLATQLLAENLTLAAVGAAAGVGIGYLLLNGAMRWAPVNAIRMAGVSLDFGVLLFTAAVAVAATMLAGIVPALSLSRASLGEALAGARASGAAMRPGPRRLLVVGEMALSVMLVLSAALIARSYAALKSTDLGFAPDRVMTMRIDLPAAEYRAEGRAIQFYRNALARIAAIPGVEAAGAVRVLPLSAPIGNWSITLEHRPTLPGEDPNGDWQIVTPGYFEAMRMQLRSGRSIGPGDTETAPLVAVVSETMAARYWPGVNAIGQRFKMGTGPTPWVEIVGIATDIRHNTVVETPRAEMYIPHPQWPRATGGVTSRLGMTLVVRTSSDPSATLARLRDEIRALDRSLPVSEVRTMNDVAADALAAPRFATLLLGAFALLALVLAAIGLYGVVSFVTASRTREIGVRIALGARPASVCRLLLRDNLAVAGAGVALGLIASVWSSRLLAGQLHGVSRFDPATFAAAPAVLLLVAIVASYLPARRATIRRPVDALRLE
jgi:predicted permease